MTQNQAMGNVSKIIDRIGFGKFHIFVILIVCMRIFSHGSETSTLVILEPYFRCKWNLDFFSAAMIVFPETLVKIFASPVIGKLADTYGRRSMMLLLFAMHSFTSLLSLLSSSLLMIVLTRAAIGFQSSGFVITQTYLMEILPTSARKYMSLLTLAYALGSIYSTLVAMVALEYLNWRLYIALTVTLPLAIAFVLVIFLPESPRYLYVTGQENASVKVLEKIAKMNGIEPGYIMTVEMEEHGTGPSSGLLKAEREDPLCRLEIARRIFLVSLLYFVSYTFEKSLLFQSMQISKNLDSEGCGNCAQQLTYKYRWAFELGLVLSFVGSYNCVGRLTRAATFRSILIFVIVLWVFYYVDPRGWYLILLTIITSTLGSVFTSVEKVYQAEVIPTSIRATGNGIASTATQCGHLLGQFLSLYLYHVNSYLSNGIVHGLLVLGLIASFTIFVETKDKRLQDF